jgi:signal-transduction protein with cAMP-binding, CBS, and nucleotidyltransferase domain
MRVNVIDPRSPVDRLATRPAVRVAKNATLEQTAFAMRAANVSSALVEGHDAIVTERDLTRAMAARLGPDDEVVWVATFEPVRVPSSTTVLDAAAKMLNEEVRHLVVVAKDGTARVVSFRDVMAVLLQAATPELWLTSLRLSMPLVSKTIQD